MSTDPAAGPAGAVSITDPHVTPATDPGVAAARWRAAQAIFLDAVEQPPATRAAWLEEATEGDDALRALVERLLDGDADAPALLDTMPRGAPAGSTGGSRLAEGATIGPYTVRHELGRGGMGTVYLADDAKHGRQVAIKVLHADLRAALAPQRFQREVRLAARLQHPHLLTVFDSGDDAGRLWYTMPYIAGETLRARLRRERPLPVAEAVRIARELAQGLAHAHAQQVVHRDVKPENVLLATDGSAVLGDFGVSRAIAARRDTEDDDPLATRLTAVGMVVGTPQYMSPEQATGAPVDASTDVYALACVLYEMLVGEPPYPGPTLGEVHRQRLAAGPPSARARRPDVPPALDATVSCALALRAEERYPDAREFNAALVESTTGATPSVGVPMAPTVYDARRAGAPPRWRRPALVALALAVPVAAGLWWQQASGRRDAAPAADASAGLVTLAVLPFENLGRPDDAYVADGLTDEIRGKLAGLSGVQIIARASSNSYRGGGTPLPRVASELGVRYLLTGTVRTEYGPDGRATRLRVRPELVRIAPGTAPVSAWQDAFDADAADVFQVQSDIAGRVAAALNLALVGGDRARLAERPTADLEAYDAFLRGEDAWNGGAADLRALRRAIDAYSQAVSLDSGFVRAWVQLSRATSFLHANTPDAGLAERARAAAERARALAPGRPGGHLALGDYYLVTRDQARALAEFDAGRRLAPDDPALVTESARAARVLGRWDAAGRDFARAAALDPRTALHAARLGSVLLYQRRPAEAARALDRSLALAPGNPTFVHTRAIVAITLGDLAAARRILAAGAAAGDATRIVAYTANYWGVAWMLDARQEATLLALGPEAFDDDRGRWALARMTLFAQRGDTAAARAWADSARVGFAAQLRAHPEEPEPRIRLALALAVLGQREQAVAEAERAVALRPLARDAYEGPYYEYQLARVLAAVGERARAAALLAGLLRVPSLLTPAWLAIDPSFAALRGEPAFDALLPGGGAAGAPGDRRGRGTP